MSAASQLEHDPRRSAIEELGRHVAALTAAGDLVGARVAAAALNRLLANDGAPVVAARGEVIDLAARRRERTDG